MTQSLGYTLNIKC